NKVLDLGYGKTVYYNSTSKTEIGKPLGQWYLYKKLGIFQSQEEIDSYVNSEGKVIQPNARPGDIKYDDYNGDGQITSDDRQICGDPWSKLDMGLNVSLEWKGLGLDINGYGRFGQTVYNGARATAGDFANNQNNFNDYIPWTQENHSTTTPRVIYGDSRNSRGDQDRWLENGSFFRFSDITLSYSIPRKALEKIRFEQIRFSATFQNLVTFTGYKGLDPEFADSGVYTIGYDGCSYPNPRGVQFGVSFTF
ncbi:MAG: TonB-dependent receptor, partial [Candidatus Cryptobacteroides sp.]